MGRLGIEHEIVDAVEIDKHAIASFNAIHGTNFETQDIITWDKDIECDLIMHGSPCQDFSLAGKQAGGDIGSGTRSSLMYETIRIVGKLRPKYVVWENVKNVLSKKHRHNFDNYLTAMQSLGYTNYYKVLNAKDYGIPQNRERVFTISILCGNKFEFPKGNPCENNIKVVGNYMPSNHDASRIVDENGLAPTVKENHGTVTAVLQRFEFPPRQELKLRLKDMLEEVVDRKYYLSDDVLQKYVPTNNDNSNVIGTLDIKGLDCIKRVYSDEGLSPTLTDMQGGNRQPKIMIKNATKKGYIEAQDGDSVNLAYPDSETRRGRVGSQVAQTLQCNDNMGVVVDSEEVDLEDLEYQEMLKADEEFAKNGYQSTDPTGGITIRKLTPKECWRLMRI